MRKPLLPALALAVAALPLSAQQQPYLVLHQEVVKPSMVAQYEAASKDFIAMVKAHKDKMPHFSFECLMSPDFVYTYVLQIPNMGGMDVINAEFGAMAQAAGHAYLDLNKRSGAATDHIRESVVQLAPELSYRPEQPRLKPEEAKYRGYSLYYVIPGREPEADQVAADYVKLYKSKNIAEGYGLYKAVLGPELPLYAVAIAARDAADYAAENAKLQETLGAEGRALAARAMALTRRFEVREAIARPDLSLPRR